MKTFGLLTLAFLKGSLIETCKVIVGTAVVGGAVFGVSKAAYKWISPARTFIDNQVNRLRSAA